MIISQAEQESKKRKDKESSASDEEEFARSLSKGIKENDGIFNKLESLKNKNKAKKLENESIHSNKKKDYKSYTEKIKSENKRSTEIYSKSKDRNKYSDSESYKEKEKYDLKYEGKKVKNKYKNDSSYSENTTLSNKSDKQATPPIPWVRENLRVRLISKDYKKGKYYKEKVKYALLLSIIRSIFLN